MEKRGQVPTGIVQKGFDVLGLEDVCEVHVRAWPSEPTQAGKFETARDAEIQPTGLEAGNWL